jgi:antitoxin CptB
MEPALDPVALNRLKWRCRRGLLENDLLIERFFARHGSCITLRQAEGLHVLMDLPDNDLLDLLLARREPSAEIDRPAVREVLAQMRRRPALAAA